jgi:hypothetical protein
MLLKLENEKGECKKIKYPESFDELIKAVKEFVPSLDNQKRYQLIDEKKGREIATQENFEIMTNEYLNNKITPKIRINLVDNNSKYIKPKLQINNKNIKQIINESIVNIPGNNKNEEKIVNGSNPINGIIKKKLKELEDNLVEQIYQSSMIEIQKSRMEEKNKDNNKIKKRIDPPPIHKGIICNKCGKEIIGERFKCVQCTNFNLCEICENNYNHDIKHIMISIVYPVENEEELNEKIDKNICYKNQNLNYSFEPKIFYFNRERDVQSQEVTIKNIGSEVWRGVWMKCFEDKSDIIGDEYNINYIMNPGDEMKIKIQFFNIKSQLVEGKKVYYSFYQMFNKANETFGDVTKIKIIFNN